MSDYGWSCGVLDQYNSSTTTTQWCYGISGITMIASGLLCVVPCVQILLEPSAMSPLLLPNRPN